MGNHAPEPADLCLDLRELDLQVEMIFGGLYISDTQIFEILQFILASASLYFYWVTSAITRPFEATIVNLDL